MRKISGLLLLVLGLPLAAFSAVQIIVLNVSDAGSNRITFNYLCWLTPPNPLPAPNFVSVWTAESGVSAGPTSGQVTALQNGTVIEQRGTITVSSSTAISSVENTMISDCQTRQAYLNGIPGPGIYYGETYNGSGWTVQ